MRKFSEDTYAHPSANTVSGLVEKSVGCVFAIVAPYKFASAVQGVWFSIAPCHHAQMPRRTVTNPLFRSYALLPSLRVLPFRLAANCRTRRAFVQYSSELPYRHHYTPYAPYGIHPFKGTRTAPDSQSGDHLVDGRSCAAIARVLAFVGSLIDEVAWV
jgi:hypothetical protein